MKKYKTDNFGICLQPENFKELIETINQEDTKAVGEPYLPTRIWRGQANIEWKIHSSAYRRLENEHKIWQEIEQGSDEDYKYFSETELIDYETKLIIQATHKGYRKNEFDYLSDFELLAKLQHHGAATRLIDFSRNAFVALWFCVTELENQTGCLIGVNYDILQGFESRRIDQNYKQVIDTLGNKPVIYDPPKTTNRISAQNAQFLFSKMVFKNCGSIDLEEELFIVISPNLKAEVKHILKSSFGFDNNYLFPDIDGFSTSNSVNKSIREMSRSNLIFGGNDNKS